MATDWIMVRIDRSTHERLERVRQSMLIGNEMGVRELTFDARDRVSLDQVISELIYIREKHAARRRKSAAKRRKERRLARLDLVVIEFPECTIKTTPEKAQEILDSFEDG